MLEEATDGLSVNLPHAARGANRDWDSVPHSANAGSGGAALLGPQRRNRRWDPREKAQITAESLYAFGERPVKWH